MQVAVSMCSNFFYTAGYNFIKKRYNIYKIIFGGSRMDEPKRDKNLGKKRITLRAVFLTAAVALAVLITQIRGFHASNYNIALDAGGKLVVHFLDVGQADCILIQSDDKNMLIDAGNNDDSEMIVHYLQDCGITYLDYVIGTHAHEDHIGSMDTIISYFNIGTLFLPEQIYETNSYRNVLDAAEIYDVNIVHPQFKDIYELGEARFVFINQDAEEEYEDINDSSLGIRISNGGHSFLMCGDINKEMEEEVINSNIYLQSDVLKLNHHGSSGSNCKDFLEAVNPKYAVVFCGKNNEFGHPHKSVVNRLKKLDISLFRTDEYGTIIFTSDGRILTYTLHRVKKAA